MKKHILSVFFIFIICGTLWSQKKEGFQPHWVVGSSYTYIFNFEDDPYEEGQEYWLHEGTWNLNAAYQFHKNFRVGVANMLIANNTKYTQREWFNISGLTFQYRYNRKQTSVLFAETSFSKGNYCTCYPDAPGQDFELPYRRKGLTYWGLGVGTEIKLAEKLVLDLGFYNYLILEKIPPKYNFTQYIVGLDYWF